jgi:PAS domain S-box-containing protein
MTKKSVKNKKITQKKSSSRGHWISEKEFSQLHGSLREAQETLEAIRGGGVDAVVVNGPNGSQIYSLTGADQPYRVYVERMQEGAATISSEGLILYANQRFADMVNQPLERVISATVTTYLSAVAWEKIHEVIKNHNEVVKCETLLQSLDKPFLPVNLTASHLPLEEENVLCLVVTDLSAQKQNEELRMAKEVAEKANVAKDAFLAALSHELRTPLNPMLLLASEGAENKDLPPGVRANFDVIRRNVELEARLIDDLLDLTRVNTGKMKLDKRSVNVHAILKATLSMMHSQIAEKEIVLKQKFESFQNVISGDAVRLQQIFWNMLANAIKFTPVGKTITIETHSSHEQYVVSISDTGIGMTSRELERVFTPFTQGDHAEEATRFGGLGLGLAIGKKLVELHSGHIEASSKGRNQGSTFIIRFPLTDWREQPVKHNLSAEYDDSIKLSGLRILLVEDHEPTRNALAGLLSRRNHKVAMAVSSREALALVGENNFDLIISDIGLPDGSGYELFKKLRKQSPSIKGIALTGYGTEHDRKRSEDSGFKAHLTKPVRIQALEAALKSTMIV